MSLVKFIPLTIIGTAAWSLLLALGGRLLGAEWSLIAEWINSYQVVVEVLVVGILMIFIALRVRKIINDKKLKTTKSNQNTAKAVFIKNPGRIKIV